MLQQKEDIQTDTKSTKIIERFRQIKSMGMLASWECYKKFTNKLKIEKLIPKHFRWQNRENETEYVALVRVLRSNPQTRIDKTDCNWRLQQTNLSTMKNNSLVNEENMTWIAF